MESIVYKKIEILIVDDIAENLQLLGNLLLENDYEVSFATNGLQAIESVEYSAPDLILLDVNMPEMDGYEVCTKLKSNEKFKNIPIIFITAKNNTEDIVKGFEVGGVDYITKPFNSKELLSRVSSHSNLKHSKELLLKANERLNNINNFNDLLLSVISHDLRNYFVNINGYVQLLESDINSFSETEILESLNVIRSNAKNAHTLLDNILQWAKAQFGGLKINYEEINLKYLIDEVVTLISNYSKPKMIKIANNINENIIIKADKNMLKTVFRNLAHNAVKFSNINSEIFISNLERVNGHIKINVTDFGTGMTEEYKNKIFNSEVKTSTPGTNNEKGNGIGLIICKDFIEMHNGSIYCDSSIGKGTTFTISLPINN